jgi:hypothetical protein
MDVVSQLCLHKQTCSVSATCTEFHEALSGKSAFCWDVKKSLAVKVTCSKSGSTSAVSHAPPPPPQNTTSFLADFGKELQGGLRLTVGDGKANQTVHIKCGEAFNGQDVTSTWGWEFDWTLREGSQVLEQHK